MATLPVQWLYWTVVDIPYNPPSSSSSSSCLQALHQRTTAGDHHYHRHHLTTTTTSIKYREHKLTERVPTPLISALCTVDTIPETGIRWLLSDQDHDPANPLFYTAAHRNTVVHMSSDTHPCTSTQQSSWMLRWSCLCMPINTHLLWHLRWVCKNRATNSSRTPCEVPEVLTRSVSTDTQTIQVVSEDWRPPAIHRQTYHYHYDSTSRYSLTVSTPYRRHDRITSQRWAIHTTSSNTAQGAGSAGLLLVALRNASNEQILYFLSSSFTLEARSRCMQLLARHGRL